VDKSLSDRSYRTLTPNSTEHLNPAFRYLKEVSSERQIPGPRIWLTGTWVVATPRSRFGSDNLFHAIQEEIGYLRNLLSCGRVAASRNNSYLLEHDYPILGGKKSPNTLGRLWELATDGGRSFFRIPSSRKSTTFCFKHAHVESSGPATEAVATCTRLGASFSPGIVMEWPDSWPAGNASFRGFSEVVERARGRLGLVPTVGLAEGQWDRPRVTVVHRLKGRLILNLGYLTDALRDEGFDVTVVALECMPLEAQLALVSNSSTLLGVHGAGLTLGHTLPPDALVIELRTSPCTEEARGVPYQMRRQNRIIPAPAVAVMPNASCPPPWKYNRREYDAVVDLDAVLRTIYEKDPIASRRVRPRWMDGKRRPNLAT